MRSSSSVVQDEVDLAATTTLQFTKRNRTMSNLPPAELLESLNDGKFFYVEFIKRSNGELRKMTARSGVFKDIIGTGLSYDPVKHNLMTVWDTQANGYRSIPVDSIVYLRAHHLEWRVENGVAA